jgi:hypothetical protein
MRGAKIAVRRRGNPTIARRRFGVISMEGEYSGRPGEGQRHGELIHFFLNFAVRFDHAEKLRYNDCV